MASPSAWCRTCSAACRAKQSVFSLEAELVPQPLAAARRLGLSDEWLRKLEIASPNQRQVLSIVRLVGGSPAVGRLKQGDIAAGHRR